MNGNEGVHSSSENNSENNSENDSEKNNSENDSENGIPKFIKRRKRNLLQTSEFQEGFRNLTFGN